MLGTFGVKNDLKVYSYHDIRSRYRGHLYSGRKGQNTGKATPPPTPTPPSFGQSLKEKFFLWDKFPYGI